MRDWKGQKVKLVVVEVETADVVYSRADYLDTDTVFDMFERFDVSKHQFSITPMAVTEDE